MVLLSIENEPNRKLVMEQTPDNQTPSPITPQTPPQTAPNATQPAPGEVDPGKTLGIVGFVLAFLVSVVGIILSAVALAKSKKAGFGNGLALAGIIVGSIVTVFWGIFLAIVISIAVAVTSSIFERCAQLGTDRVYISGEYYSCPGDNSSSDSESSDTTGREDIARSAVTLESGSVESKCFSFELPKEYIMSPTSTTCQTELRGDNGTATGIAATSITVKYQTGAPGGVDDFFDAYKKAGDRVSNEKRFSVNGYEAASLNLVDGSGIQQAVYFITDDSGNFSIGSKPVDSYLITGPANIPAPLETIVNSFAIK